jgi:hypothetical protein
LRSSKIEGLVAAKILSKSVQGQKQNVNDPYNLQIKKNQTSIFQANQTLFLIWEMTGGYEI